MAKRSKTKRRPPKKAGRRASSRRSSRRRGGFFRGGFIDRTMLKPTAGVVAGFILPDMALRILPASVQASIASVKYGPMLAKAALGLVGGYFGRRFDATIASSFAIGSLAAGGLDLIYRLKGQVGAPVASITTNNTPNRVLAPTGVAGLIDVNTGEQLNGFIDNDGAVLNRFGQQIGDLYDGEDEEMGDSYDEEDEAISGFVENN